jgi:transcription elongation factor GreA
MDLSLFITQEGMDRIQRRISQLMNNERPEVIKAVAIAREFGDLSENAEYKAARERQRAIDSEIDHLRKRAARLKVVDTSVFPKDSIRFGSVCETTDLDSGEKTVYKVVGADELSFFDNDQQQPVSVISPVGKALLGKKPGEVCVFRAPMGERRLRVEAVL